MTSAVGLHSSKTRRPDRDRDLEHRASEGDPQALATLVEQHYQRALRVAQGFVSTVEDAEDVVQEAFVRICRGLHGFRVESGFYTWLYRIVVNLSIDKLRQRRRQRRADLEDEHGRDFLTTEYGSWPRWDETNPFENVRRGELRACVERAFTQMPPIHQSVLLLREIEGMSYEEIADALAIKKGTVMSRLFHARRTMQEALIETNRRVSLELPIPAELEQLDAA